MNKKIIVKASSGLGDQMFMYAHAYALAKKLKYKLITFFILPPSRKILLERLYKRDLKDKLIVEERMKQFDKDILKWKSYDFVVINDKLNICYKQIMKLIKLKKSKVKKNYNHKLIENHIKLLKK